MKDRVHLNRHLMSLRGGGGGGKADVTTKLRKT
jgi:hypothetical protein